jgi:hypothetical protein
MWGKEVNLLEFILPKVVFVGFWLIVAIVLFEDIKLLIEVTFPKKPKQINT